MNLKSFLLLYNSKIDLILINTETLEVLHLKYIMDSKLMTNMINNLTFIKIINKLQVNRLINYTYIV